MVATSVLPHSALPDFLKVRREGVAPIVDLLTLFDTVAGLLTGYAGLFIYTLFTHHHVGRLISTGPMTRDILFETTIICLVLRRSSDTTATILENAREFVTSAMSRLVLATSVLVGIGISTRALHDVACLWVVGWTCAFAGFSIMGRVTLVAVLRRNHGCQRGSAPDVATSAPADPAPVATTEKGVDISDGSPEVDGPETCAAAPVVGETPSTPVVALEREAASLAMFVPDDEVAPCLDPPWADTQALPPAPDPGYMAGIPIAAAILTHPLVRWDVRIKHACDRCLAFALILVLLPLLVAICLVVGLSSPGPILFHQQRCGWGGRQFDLLKFRTMFHHASDPAARFRQTSQNDPRCTRVGRVLRRTSLDELPQLWNVVRGEMSLVGPRPHASAMRTEDRLGEEIVAGYALRNRMKPGLTGWAQVHGSRGATTTVDQLRERLRYDLDYIEKWNLLLDLRIMFMTAKVLISQDNAF